MVTRLRARIDRDAPDCGEWVEPSDEQVGASVEQCTLDRIEETYSEVHEGRSVNDKAALQAEMRRLEDEALEQMH
jgi:hypothetical protein